MLAHYFALLMGIAFTLAGVGGFIPGITQPPPAGVPSLTLPASYGLLLGLFPINLVHNLIHLGFGIWGLLAYGGYTSARLFAQALAVILGVFTLMGLLPALQTTFGLLPLFGHDIWLHAVEAAAAFYVGFIHRPAVEATHEIS